MEYAIESVWSEHADSAIEALEQKIKAMIADGWIPFAAPSLAFTPRDRSQRDGVDGFTAIQALQRVSVKVEA